MKRALVLIAAQVLSAASAHAAIGTPINLGQSNATGVASLAMTTAVDAPAGNLVVVAVTTHLTTITSVSDPINGAYSLCSGPYLVGGERVALYYTVNGVDLPSASTITIALTTSASNKVIVAAATVSGVRSTQSCDINGAGATGTGTGAISGPSTGTLNRSPEIVFAPIKVVGAVPGESFAQPSSWSPLTPSGSSAASAVLDWGYIIDTTTASETYSPTLGATSRTWLANTASFFDASIPLPAGTGTRVATTGIGH